MSDLLKGLLPGKPALPPSPPSQKKQILQGVPILQQHLSPPFGSFLKIRIRGKHGKKILMVLKKYKGHPQQKRSPLELPKGLPKFNTSNQS